MPHDDVPRYYVPCPWLLCNKSPCLLIELDGILYIRCPAGHQATLERWEHLLVERGFVPEDG